MDARHGLNLGLYTPAALARTDPERLVRNHLGLVRKLAWHTHARVSTALDIEELVQIGMVALIEAARTFEDRGQAAFATYAPSACAAA
jgi:RNA polymerase sigma factor for flagellar operon FliA